MTSGRIAAPRAGALFSSRFPRHETLAIVSRATAGGLLIASAYEPDADNSGAGDPETLSFTPDQSGIWILSVSGYQSSGAFTATVSTG